MVKINWTLSTILAAASCVATAPQAWGQQPYLAKFTLPMEARFGSTVLHPGDYQIYRVVGMDAIRITGEGGTATVLASSADSRAAFEGSRIVLKNVNGAYALTRLDSEASGKRYDFTPNTKAFKNSERASVAMPGSVDVPLRAEGQRQ